ncbi:hypothetical protein OY671_009877, partial [Metschnikowia pulcherrima]
RLCVLCLRRRHGSAGVGGDRRGGGAVGRAGRGGGAGDDPADAGRIADLGVHDYRGVGVDPGGRGGTDSDRGPAPPAGGHAARAGDGGRGVRRAQGVLRLSGGAGAGAAGAGGVPLSARRGGVARHRVGPGGGVCDGHQRAAGVLAVVGGGGRDRGGVGGDRGGDRRHLVVDGRVRPVGAGGGDRGRAGQR